MQVHPFLTKDALVRCPFLLLPSPQRSVYLYDCSVKVAASDTCQHANENLMLLSL